MGLDIYCEGFEGVRVGSYSTVQEIRKHWIGAYIQYLRSIQYKEQEIEKLEITIQKKFVGKLEGSVMYSENIDYELFSELRIEEQGFDGLDKFVNHSDCEGEWPYEDVEEILTTLGLIRKFLKPITFDWDFYKKGEADRYYLEDIFEYSVQYEKDVMLC